MPHSLDVSAVRRWCDLALDGLTRERGALDEGNVFPVADGDTGTNMCRTLQAARDELAAGQPADAAHALRAMARGALLGACGNSGTILAQLLRGMAEVHAEPKPGEEGAALLRRALRRAADSAYEAVARPVEGTVLTVARAAADAADATSGDPLDVARAAHRGAREALARTPEQLDVLARAGVVDAGGAGLVAVLAALTAALGGGTGSGEPPVVRAGGPVGAPEPAAPPGSPPPGPQFEVMYLLDADDHAVPALRSALDALGDSLVVVGGEGLWNVHVHTGDAGAAVEEGLRAGRPHRLRITYLPGPGAEAGADAGAHPACPAVPPAPRAVVAVVAGEGLAELCEQAGAHVVRTVPGESHEDALAQAVAATGAGEVVLLPGESDLHPAAVRVASRARAEGHRVALIPTRAAVQGLAALAVHDPARAFDEDVVAMTSAAGATRYGEVCVAEHRSWTSAGVCRAGDVLGLVEGDVALIGTDVAQVAGEVLERMLAAGGELVTLVLGDDAPGGLADALRERVRRGHLGVDTVVHDGGGQDTPLAIGVE